MLDIRNRHGLGSDGTTTGGRSEERNRANDLAGQPIDQRSGSLRPARGRHSRRIDATIAQRRRRQTTRATGRPGRRRAREAGRAA